MKQLYTRLLSAALLTAGILFPAHALEWTLQGSSFTVDTTYHATIGPGTTHTLLSLNGSGKLKLFYTTTDLSNPYADIRATKGATALNGLAVLSTQQKQADRPGARYYAGINADFFGGNRPCGSVVVDDKTIYAINNGWDSFYMLSDGTPALGRLIFSGTAVSGDKSHAITGINIDRGENYLVVYNRYRGTATGSNVYGYELRLQLLEGTVGYTGTARCKVLSAAATGSTAISGDELVLSGHGLAAEFVKNLAVGDEVTLNFTSNTPGGVSVSQLAGGLPVILSEGKTLDTQNALDHLTSLHPRSAVGFDASRTKVVLLVVDGRSTASKGVTSRQLADIMRYLGCTEALNFDGGGSSEFYTSKLGIRNHPSDGKERAVCDAVWNVANAPDDNEVATIAFEYHSTFAMPKYGYYSPKVYAYNRYGVLLDTDFKDYTLSCDDALGQIVDNGLTLFGNGEGTHVLTAHYGESSATQIVEIGSETPHFLSDAITIDNHRTHKVEVGAEVKGEIMKLDNSALSWITSDSGIVTVDEGGNIRGLAEGTATITGSINDFEGRMTVNVEFPAARHMAICPAGDWELTTAGLGTAELTAGDNGSVTVGYNVKNSRSATVTLRHDCTLRALPDSIRIAMTADAGQVKSIVYGLQPNGAKFVTHTLTLDATEENPTVLLPMSDIFDPEEIYNYPVDFSYLKFNLNPKTGQDFALKFHGIDAVYAHMPQSSAVENIIAGNGGKLSLTPGAVHPGTAVTVKNAGAAAKWQIFTITGHMAAAGQGATIDTAALAPGIYIVHCCRQAAKLLVY